MNFCCSTYSYIGYICIIINQILHIMDNEYIIPTKDNPVFTASSDYFGNIEKGFYKNALIANSTTAVFALKFTEAVISLHQWLIERGQEELLYDKKATYTIYMIDGTVDKWEETKRVPVYKISAKKAIKYLF